jgi:hypothetical protein
MERLLSPDEPRIVSQNAVVFCLSWYERHVRDGVRKMKGAES